MLPEEAYFSVQETLTSPGVRNRVPIDNYRSVIRHAIMPAILDSMAKVAFSQSRSIHFVRAYILDAINSACGRVDDRNRLWINSFFRVPSSLRELCVGYTDLSLTN